jgi:hypothetical protein
MSSPFSGVASGSSLGAWTAWTTWCAAAIALLATALAVAAPQPDAVPSRWQLTVEPGPLRVMLVDTPDAGVRPFYYWTFDVQNNTGEDQFLAPKFELATDTGQIYRSGRGVPREVTEEILRRLRNPLLEDELSAQGRLLQGEEHAKTVLVVWPVQELDVDEISIYASGLSGETDTVIRPDTGETVVLRQTLMLRHDVPGTLNIRTSEPLSRTLERWIMR